MRKYGSNPLVYFKSVIPFIEEKNPEYQPINEVGVNSDIPDRLKNGFKIDDNTMNYMLKKRQELLSKNYFNQRYLGLIPDLI